MRAGAIIQARLGSSRLPGKVLMPLAATTVLGCVLQRAAAIDGIDVVCCAVPEGEADDAVAAEAARAGAVVFRGAEEDVLDRYYRAARSLDLDVVMRITSDCPLLDPRLCASLLAMFRQLGADYVCNNMPPTWPHGLDCEVIAMPWLERAWAEADQPWQREHVTPFIRRHPDARRANLPMGNGGFSGLRWTLDHPRDLVALRAIVARLPAGAAGWDHRAALAVIAAEPALADINAGYDREEGLTRSIKRAMDAAA